MVKVILTEDVKSLGHVGDLVNVREGYARNFLFPRGLAEKATENKVRAFEHQKRVASIRRQKAQAEKASLVEKLSAVSLTFHVKAAESDKIFGSITSQDIAEQLKAQGYEFDRRDIQIDEAIKVLGQHRARVALGSGVKAEISVLVERLVESQKAAATEEPSARAVSDADVETYESDEDSDGDED